MKPVAIFRHTATEGPGYFAQFLDQQQIPWELIKIDQGETVPTRATDFSGLCFMGGPMSVNDPLPWIEPILSLIRDAVAEDVPVLGHCLGGQLIAKALGGVVTRNPVKEIGWGRVFQVSDSATATTWLGGFSKFLSFHWHGETFSLPAGAELLLSSEYCPHQLYVLNNKHLGMQCHVEMTEEMIRCWNQQWADEVQHHLGPSVQTPEAMYQDLGDKLSQLNAAAAQLYHQWIKGLRS